MPAEVSDVHLPAGEKVVEADDLVALAQKTVAQMRAKETRSSSDQDAHARDIVAERSPSWPAKRTARAVDV
jgi:hypothetical protein